MTLISGINLRTKSRLAVPPHSFSAYVTVSSGVFTHIDTVRASTRWLSLAERVRSLSCIRACPLVRALTLTRTRSAWMRSSAVQHACCISMCIRIRVCVWSSIKSQREQKRRQRRAYTRCREKSCTARDEGGRGKGWRRRRNGWRRWGFSLSLISTLRIPNLGHTDTNAISVSVGERPKGNSGRGARNESRNSSRGGPKVTNLQTAAKRKCEREVVSESRARNYARFRSSRVITRIPNRDVFFARLFFWGGK